MTGWRIDDGVGGGSMTGWRIDDGVDEARGVEEHAMARKDTLMAVRWDT